MKISGWIYFIQPWRKWSVFTQFCQFKMASSVNCNGNNLQIGRSSNSLETNRKKYCQTLIFFQIHDLVLLSFQFLSRGAAFSLYFWVVYVNPCSMTWKFCFLQNMFLVLQDSFLTLITKTIKFLRNYIIIRRPECIEFHITPQNYYLF